jgi:hypothetical protein
MLKTIISHKFQKQHYKHLFAETITVHKLPKIIKINDLQENKTNTTIDYLQKL